jgi:hypothetical protein
MPLDETVTSKTTSEARRFALDRRFEAHTRVKIKVAEVVRDECSHSLKSRTIGRFGQMRPQ